MVDTHVGSSSELTPVQAYINANKAELVQRGRIVLSALQSGGVPDFNNWYQELGLDVVNANHQQTNPIKTALDTIVDLPRILKRWLNTDIEEQRIKQRKDMLSAVICLMWAINRKAEDAGQGFERGSFKLLQDPCVLKFLEDYVVFATGRNTIEQVHELNGNRFGYSRRPDMMRSSHYKECAHQFGIDLRFAGTEYTIGLLPHGHQHILFGRVDANGDNATFLKFEEIGIGTIEDNLMHLVHFVHSITHAPSGSARREKDVPSEIKAVYSDFVTVAGQEAKQKPTVIDIFKAINADHDNARKALYLERLNQAALAANVDHLDKRHGNEVIIEMTSAEVSVVEPVINIPRAATATIVTQTESARISIDSSVQISPVTSATGTQAQILPICAATSTQTATNSTGEASTQISTSHADCAAQTSVVTAEAALQTESTVVQMHDVSVAARPEVETSDSATQADASSPKHSATACTQTASSSSKAKTTAQAQNKSFIDYLKAPFYRNGKFDWLSLAVQVTAMAAMMLMPLTGIGTAIVSRVGMFAARMAIYHVASFALNQVAVLFGLKQANVGADLKASFMQAGFCAALAPVRLGLVATAAVSYCAQRMLNDEASNIKATKSKM